MEADQASGCSGRRPCSGTTSTSGSKGWRTTSCPTTVNGYRQAGEAAEVEDGVREVAGSHALDGGEGVPVDGHRWPCAEDRPQRRQRWPGHLRADHHEQRPGPPRSHDLFSTVLGHRLACLLRPGEQPGVMHGGSSICSGRDPTPRRARPSRSGPHDHHGQRQGRRVHDQDQEESQEGLARLGDPGRAPGTPGASGARAEGCRIWVRHDTGLVFTREDGAGAPSRWLQPHVRMPGQEGRRDSPIRLHDLRHTHATLAPKPAYAPRSSPNDWVTPPLASPSISIRMSLRRWMVRRSREGRAAGPGARPLRPHIGAALPSSGAEAVVWTTGSVEHLLQRRTAAIPEA